MVRDATQRDLVEMHRLIATNPSEQQVLEKLRSQFSYSAGVRVTASYGMLLGFAVENLLKAIHLAKHPQDVRRVAELWGGSRGHNLAWLAAGAGVDVSNARKLLEDLTQCTMWMGRYPIPLRGEQAWSFQFDYAKIESFYTDLVKQYTAAAAKWAACEPTGRHGCRGVPLF
jgi:hypothetical protein